jgi:hypothetical protein
MQSIRRLSLPLLISAGLVLAFSAPGVHATGAGAAKTHKLTVTITDTGTLWGTVKVAYTAAGKSKTKTCAKTKCSWSLATGTKVTLTQTPTNSTTWPFKEWQVKTGSTKTNVTTSPLKLTMNAPYSVNALYVVG